MKRVVFILTCLFVGLVMYGQNTFKYEVRARGGLSVGTGNVKLDSIVMDGDSLKFYSGGGRVVPLGWSDIDMTVLSDTLLNYSRTSHVHTIGSLNDNVIDSAVVVNGKLAFFIGVDTAGFHILESDFEDIRTIDSDTVPLFVFGTGSGHSADTALFNNDRLAGAFYNSGSDTLYVTELRGVLVEGTGTETIDVQVSWDVNMKDATPTNLNTTALTITSMTTGTADASFNNNGIPPGVWVWCTLSGASKDNKPTMLILTMTGYKRNRTY